jgi:hypothetical protein
MEGERNNATSVRNGNAGLMLNVWESRIAGMVIPWLIGAYFNTTG